MSTTEHGPHSTRPRAAVPAYVTSPAWTGHPTTDLSWQARSNCATTDPDLFHPELEEGHGTSAHAAARAAARVCDRCDVEAACLVYALERRERNGHWGGTAPYARREMITAIIALDRADKETAAA